MDRSVFCVADSQTAARAIVVSLKASGFADANISILFPEAGSARDIAFQRGTKAPEGATAGALSGGALGGLVGVLAGIGALAIPGVGPLIAAGPLLAALSVAAVGAAVGGVTGGLVGLGIPEIQAKLYAGKLNEGKVLVSAHCDDAAQLRRAKTIFEEAGGHDIYTVNEARPPSRNVLTPTV